MKMLSLDGLASPHRVGKDTNIQISYDDYNFKPEGRFWIGLEEKSKNREIHTTITYDDAIKLKNFLIENCPDRVERRKGERRKS